MSRCTRGATIVEGEHDKYNVETMSMTHAVTKFCRSPKHSRQW